MNFSAGQVFIKGTWLSRLALVLAWAGLATGAWAQEPTITSVTVSNDGESLTLDIVGTDLSDYASPVTVSLGESTLLVESVEPGFIAASAEGPMAAGEYVLTVTSGSESVSYDLTVPAAGTSSVVVSDAGKNTAAGTNALASNTTGKHNTAAGFTALESNTEGDRNTASGSTAMKANTIGEDNTAIGKGALKGNVSGNQNTAIGRGSLRDNEFGNNNIAIGDDAGSAVVGDDNITIGNVGDAGDTATTRIGTEGVQTRAFMAGIKDVDQSAGDPVFVGVDGQLGIGDVLEGPQGPQGKIGPQGEQGPQGKPGLQGEQGPQGKAGEQGEPGEQGVQGKIGPEGEQGVQGKIGLQGEQGVQGKLGPQGIPGIDGANCWEAVEGGETVADCIGDDGDQGVQGKIGPQGDPGADGIGCSLDECVIVAGIDPAYGEATLSCGETWVQVPCAYPEGCYYANGLLWCEDVTLPDQSCNSICEAKGLQAIEDSTAWFEAQDTVAECTAIRDVFGYISSVSLAAWSFMCAQHRTDDSAFFGCSESSSCPDAHRTGSDDYPLFTGVCPCEEILEVR